MRMFFAVSLLSLLSSLTLAQPLPLIEGSCVMGVTEVKNGRLTFERQIRVYRNATDEEPFDVMRYHDSYYVASSVRDGKRVRLVIASGLDSNPNAGKVYGWVEQSDIQVLNDINCI